MSFSSVQGLTTPGPSGAAPENAAPAAVPPGSALAELDGLHQRLAQIESPRDAKDETRWAAAMLELARALGLGLEEQNRIAEHRLRSQRQGGAYLQVVAREPRAGAGRPRKFGHQAGVQISGEPA